MNCQIRNATLYDLPRIYVFELAYIREIEPAEEAHWKDALPLHLKQWITNLPRMFIAQQGEESIGHCFWQTEEFEAVLASLYVFPAWRRQGCGSLLLQRFEEDAQASGFTRLALGVHESNPAAQLYCRSGYVLTHATNSYRYYGKST